jgi:hypothetical protein
MRSWTLIALTAGVITGADATAAGRPGAQGRPGAFEGDPADLFVCLYPVPSDRPVWCATVGGISRLYPEDALPLAEKVQETLAGLKTAAALQTGAHLGCVGAETHRAAALLASPNRTGMWSTGGARADACKGGKGGQFLPESVGKLNTAQAGLFDYFYAYLEEDQACRTAQEPGGRPSVASGGDGATKRKDANSLRNVAGRLWEKIGGKSKEKEQGGGGGGIRGYCFVDQSCGSDDACASTAHRKAFATALKNMRYDGCNANARPTPDGGNVCYSVLSGRGAKDKATRDAERAALQRRFCEKQQSVARAEGFERTCDDRPKIDLQRGREVCKDPRALCTEEQNVPPLVAVPPSEPPKGGGPAPWQDWD